MKKLIGLNEYLKQNYNKSFFDIAENSDTFYDFYIHGHQIIIAKVVENQFYQLVLRLENGDHLEIAKLEVKFVHEKSYHDKVRKLIEYNNHVKKLELKPILSTKYRNHIKNKSLFPLMKDKEVLFFTMLEGEVLRGIISGFSKYEIFLNLKGGIPVVLLRHAIYDVRDKKHRCYLKRIQEKAKDWQKSKYFQEDKNASATEKIL